MEGAAVLSRSVAADVRRGGLRAHFVQRYWAFLSYSHQDSATADWLHRALERFRVPKTLVGRRAERFLIPDRLSPIFRDRSELAAADDLSEEIREAIECSRHLVVLCSPAAAQSRWVDEEIRTFKQLRPDGEVLAAIVSGEPWASRIPGREMEECFPPALRERFDEDGEPTGEPSEPIAADLREDRDGRSGGLLKIVAGMLDVRFDELVQRNELRRQRRLAGISIASLAGMLLTSGLAVTAIQARDAAREQRREAEGLIGFMLGDLRSRLEPIGKLEALDVVAARALQYYQKQDTASLTDDGLAQRAKALTMMGDIAQRRADLDGALRRYREAAATTSELLRRNPDDAQRVFDHSQNMFYLGSIALQRGRVAEAAGAFRQYKAMAERMIALQPNRRDYRMEGIYADHNLGALLIKEEEKYGEAERLFAATLPPLERLIGADPLNLDYQKQLLESLSYLADAQAGQGRLQQAIRTRERNVGVSDRNMAAFPEDMELRLKRMGSEQALARLYLATGQTDQALVRARDGVKLADQLITSDPANAEWSERAARTYFTESEVHVARGDVASAEIAARTGCEIVNRLVAGDPSVIMWSEVLGRQCLLSRARIALRSGSAQQALALATDTITNVRASRQDSLRRRADLARARLFSGEALAMLGRNAEASEQWRLAVQEWPLAPQASPDDLALRTILLKRLGQSGSAQGLAARLQAAGYRHPLYLRYLQQGTA